jgi:hypothetical protein
MKKGQARRPAAVSAGDRKAMTEFLTKGGQWLLPLVELLERSAAAIDDVIDVAGRATIKAVLQLSAGNVAGPKVQGQSARRDVYWYGSQQGDSVLSDRRRAEPGWRSCGPGASISSTFSWPGWMACSSATTTCWPPRAWIAPG